MVVGVVRCVLSVARCALGVACCVLRVLVRRCVGVWVGWSVGWCNGVLVCWCVGVGVRLFVCSECVCQCVNMLVCH